jgi:hypothetical protein
MRTDNLQQFVKLRRQLTEEKASIERRLQQINEALGGLDSIAPAAATTKGSGSDRGGAKAKAGKGGKRQMSAEARARIAEAQRRRWAERRQESGADGQSNGSQDNGSGPFARKKRKMSPAGRKAIAEAARRRWAEAKASGKSTL